MSAIKTRGKKKKRVGGGGKTQKGRSRDSLSWIIGPEWAIEPGEIDGMTTRKKGSLGRIALQRREQMEEDQMKCRFEKSCSFCKTSIREDAKERKNSTEKQFPFPSLLTDFNHFHDFSRRLFTGFFFFFWKIWHHG